MAHFPSTRSAVADFGGKRLQDHKLVLEIPVGIRHSDQRSSPDETVQKSAHRTGGRGSGQSASDEVTNEDDDEDSSGGQEGEQEEEDDDPEVQAPSHGFGLGKGKRPAIHIYNAGKDEAQNDDEETSSRVAGFKTSKHPVNQALMQNKKRTFSNISNTSVLFGDDDHASEQQGFPRKRLAHKNRLLSYKPGTDTDPKHGFDTAIASSDDEQEKMIDTDDEDYSGVNLVPEDSDVEDIEQQEEQWIINDTKHAAILFQQDARRLSLGSSASDKFFDMAAPLDESFFADNAFPDIGFSQFFEPDPLPTSPEPIANRKYSDSSTKRVRFDDDVKISDSSSSSASELDSSTWPDLFLEQDKLPIHLYQRIENDHNDSDNMDPSSGSEHSYWDVGQDESHILRVHDSDDFDDSSAPGSSGYETDMGDTTDEYDSDFASPPPKTPKQKTVLRRPSTPGSKASSPKPFQRSRPAPNGRVIPPICGVFIHDDRNQAIAVTSKSTKTVTFYRPRAPLSLRQPNYAAAAYSSSTSTANNSPRTSIQQFNAEDSDFSEAYNNPFQSSTDIMLTGIFGSAPASNYLLGGSSVGPPEAFYPFVSIGQNGNIVSDEDVYEEDDELFEDDLNLADFMDFGSDADITDVEEDEETDVPATPATSMIALNGSTPAQPTPNIETPISHKRNASDVMLEHFDRGVVTAFRNNQNRYRDIACLPHDPDLRASVSRPIRSGRSAETLISPLRKRGSMSKKRGPSAFAGVTKATGRLQSSVMGANRGPRMGTFS